MPEKIAIDVVLLFPDSVNQICKDLNKGSDKNEYISFEDGYNPHLTLGMGSLLISDIEKFNHELEVIVADTTIGDIALISIGVGKYSHFNIEMTDSLRKLHTNVIDLISKYSAGDVDVEHFYEMTERGSLIDWVNNFKVNASYEKYNPHVTLGVGIADVSINFPIIAKPKSIGLFHLGKHGTCKKLLQEFPV